MTSISIYDEFWVDERIRLLEAKLGCRHSAWGMALKGLHTAKFYWTKDKKKELIPEDVFLKLGLSPLLDCDLAKRTDKGIYVGLKGFS